MANLPTRYNFGAAIKNINDTLYNQLNDSYTDIANAVNPKTNKFVTSSDPSNSASSNANFTIGDLHINQATNNAWIMTSRTTNTNVVWTLIT